MCHWHIQCATELTFDQGSWKALPQSSGGCFSEKPLKWGNVEIILDWQLRILIKFSFWDLLSEADQIAALLPTFATGSVSEDNKAFLGQESLCVSNENACKRALKGLKYYIALCIASLKNGGSYVHENINRQQAFDGVWGREGFFEGIRLKSRKGLTFWNETEKITSNSAAAFNLLEMRILSW